MFEVTHIAHYGDQTISFNLAFCFDRPWPKVKLSVPAYRLPHLGNWKRAIEQHMHHIGVADLALRCDGGSIGPDELPTLVDMLVSRPETAAYDDENFEKLIKYLRNDHLVKFFVRLGKDPIMLREASFGSLAGLTDKGKWEWECNEYFDSDFYYFEVKSLKCPISSKFIFAAPKEI